MSRYQFLVDTYATERLKTLSAWSQVPGDRMTWRPEPRGRSALEHMVHQCQSEHAWMTKMLGIDVSRPILPEIETRANFIATYAACSAERLAALGGKDDAWFEAMTMFFEVERSRAWVLVRRFTHSAHHRGQLNAYLREWGEALYSIYGPTADTGGLPKDGAAVVYRYASIEEILRAEHDEIAAAALPDQPRDRKVTER
jgi:uncharacterized damage-inducible protein DinB